MTTPRPVVRAQSVTMINADGSTDLFTPALHLADDHRPRLLVGGESRDAADRKLAEKIARETWDRNADIDDEAWPALDHFTREGRIETALAGIRAGREQVAE